MDGLLELRTTDTPWILKLVPNRKWTLMILSDLKVSKFQKQIFLFSFEPKTNEIIFWFLPKPLKRGRIKKNEGSLLY